MGIVLVWSIHVPSLPAQLLLLQDMHAAGFIAFFQWFFFCGWCFQTSCHAIVAYLVPEMLAWFGIWLFRVIKISRKMKVFRINLQFLGFLWAITKLCVNYLFFGLTCPHVPQKPFRKLYMVHHYPLCIWFRTEKHTVVCCSMEWFCLSSARYFCSRAFDLGEKTQTPSEIFPHRQTLCNQNCKSSDLLLNLKSLKQSNSPWVLGQSCPHAMLSSEVESEQTLRTQLLMTCTIQLTSDSLQLPTPLSCIKER